MVCDKDQSLLGIEKLSTTRHDAKPLLFKYEKELNMTDLENSEDLYLKIVRGKESVDYLKKLMEKKGVLKVPHNPIKGTRFTWINWLLPWNSKN